MKKISTFFRSKITRVFLLGISIVTVQNAVAQCDPPVPNVEFLPDIVISNTCSYDLQASDSPFATNMDGDQIEGWTNNTHYAGVGSWYISWSYYDNLCGVEIFQDQLIIINYDPTPIPDLSTLPDITGECSVTVLDAPTATTDCDGSFPGITTDPLTYTTAGTHVITWTYEGYFGSPSTQTQNVIVSDNTAPVADVTSLSDITANCSVQVVSTPTATDACAGNIDGTTSDPLTYNAAGTYVITWTYDDGKGNTSTQTQNVIVSDNTAPVADATSLPDLTGICSVEVLSIPTASDYCVGNISAATYDPLSYFETGVYVINWSYNDGNGNTSTQTQNVIISGIDVSYTLSGNTITANQAGATYRWLDCNNANAIIPSETAQSFTATASGNYAVEITFGGCVDTSACENISTVGIKETTKSSVSIYPNPTTGMFNVNTNNNNSLINYAIFTVEGRMVVEGRTNENIITLDLQNESKGIYFLKINEENTSKTYKVIKE